MKFFNVSDKVRMVYRKNLQINPIYYRANSHPKTKNLDHEMIKICYIAFKGSIPIKY